MSNISKIRHVFVTGGAQGIGKGISKALSSRGAKVCLADVNSTVGSRTQDELRSETKNSDVMFVTCDVTNETQFRDAVQTAIRKYGNIDLFVNNAGIIDEQNWRKCVDVNQNGVILGTNLAMEHMRKDKGGNGGQIVNVASMAGFVPLHAVPTYCATKSAVIAYTSSLASGQNIRDTGISFLCLSPAFADTAMIHQDESKVLDLPFVKELVKKLGVLKLDTVIDGFLKLVEENVNGSILSVTTQGIEYKTKSNEK